MGNKNVGKSTLLEAYLWKLKYGCAYHDHTVEEVRYLIDAIEIETIEELRLHLIEHIEMKNIYFVCFNVNDRKTLQTARNDWILELLKHNPKLRIFLVGLQCDLREQLLVKLTHDYVSHSDGVTISRYYEKVHYLECSSNKPDSVQDLFDKAIKIVLYEDDASGNEKKIIEFYEQIQINFKFKKCNCETKCDECE
ncbi:ras-related protein ced-10-like [Calliphora vicina]|uniref:ras-related protein ced-10-like n=1 Tax=Calliphora vicina TaxID=7373 RepID=UPI00325B5CDB